MITLLCMTLLPGAGYAAGLSGLSGRTVWEARFPAEPDDTGRQATGLAADPDGNIVVSGYVEGKDGNYDALVLKYKPDGALLWSRAYDYSWHDVGYAAAAGHDGEVYIADTSQDLENPVDKYLNVYSAEYVALRYGPDGKLVFDAASHGYGRNCEPADIAVDGEGNIYLTGYATVPTGSYTVYYTVKFSASGELAWEKPEDWGVDARAVAIALDPDGNALVTGYMMDSINQNNDIRTLKYSPDTGRTLMDKTYRSLELQEDEKAADMAVMPDGGFVVTGGTTALPGGTTLTVAYGPDGSAAWASPYAGADGPNSGAAVCMDQYGRAYVLAATPEDEGVSGVSLLVYDTDGITSSALPVEFGGARVQPADIITVQNGDIIVAVNELPDRGVASIRLMRIGALPPPGRKEPSGAQLLDGRTRISLFWPAMPMARARKFGSILNYEAWDVLSLSTTWNNTKGVR